ncbi:MAG: DUF3710 domain-containing protein, partial [Nocardioides sp.]
MDSEVQPSGPFDITDLPADGVSRLDLGSLLVAAPGQRQVRLAMTEGTQEVTGVQVVGPDGAVELRAFAAPRNDDRWEEVRAELIAGAAAQGVTFTERPGRFGTEIVSAGAAPQPGAQRRALPTRIVGVNGPRWLLRATFAGAAASTPEGIA